MRLRPVAPSCALALILALTACGSDVPDDETAAPGRTEPSRTMTDQPSPGDAVPEESTPAGTPGNAAQQDERPPDAQVDVPAELDFTAPTVDGGTFEGASLVGTPAVLWFWAPWCAVCRREAPLMADLATKYDGQVSFVGVAGLSGDIAAMEDFIADGGVGGIPHIDDRGGEVYTRFGVTQQYDIGFVTADGEVEVISGPLSEDEIVAEVERLIAG